MKVDMLINSHHRLTQEQHHAYQKASRKRRIKGKEAIVNRKNMANSLSRHIRLNLSEKGTLTE